jgi:DNA-directed RNA polymerase specialized sigma subunit
MSACDTRRKMTRNIAIVAACFAAAACKSSERTVEKHLRLDDVLEVRHQISVQFLRIATDRDAVSDGLGAAVDHCNPRSSDAAYKRVESELDQLINTLSKEPLDAKVAHHLRSVRNDWSAVSITHHKLWVESEGADGVSPEDRCLRLSAIADRILSVESNFDAVIRYAASPRRLRE